MDIRTVPAVWDWDMVAVCLQNHRRYCSRTWGVETEAQARSMDPQLTQGQRGQWRAQRALGGGGGGRAGAGQGQGGGIGRRGRVPTHLAVEQAVDEEDEDALEAVDDGEQVSHDNCCRSDLEKAQHPGAAQDEELGKSLEGEQPVLGWSEKE